MPVKSVSDYRKYLDPSVISKLKTLELRARSVVEGFMVGLHKSPYHGFSAEFSEHRSYMQGDPIKNIDWKVYAKSERFYIKQYEEETNLVSHILLDVSKSMDYKHSGSITKLEYAITLAASLIYIMINQQDAAGLTVYSDAIQSYFPPKASRVYLSKLLAALSSIQPEGKTRTAGCLNEVAGKIKKRGLIIVISDFFDKPEEILSALKQFHYKKNEVIIFQILDPVEKSFGFDSDAVFIDKETAEEMNTQPGLIQRSYQEAMVEFLHKLKSECLNYGIEYNLIDTDQPFDKALLNYFKKRVKLH